MNIFFCNCGGGIFSEKKLNTLRNSLKSLNVKVFELKDLCGLAVSKDQNFIDLMSSEDQKNMMVACYPRAVENIFKQNNIPSKSIEVLNFRELSPEDIIKRISNSINQSDITPQYQELKSNLKVPAWYPVVDQSRCTLCGKCANFCLFGVYKHTKKDLKVVKPLSCKNNCPACGRRCPASAIIFPRLQENTALSGDEGVVILSDEDKTLLAALGERNKKRKRLISKEVMDLAEQERQNALNEAKKKDQN